MKQARSDISLEFTRQDGNNIRLILAKMGRLYINSSIRNKVNSFVGQNLATEHLSILHTINWRTRGEIRKG